MKPFPLFAILILLFTYAAVQPAVSQNPKYKIMMDLAHKPIFWNDPADVDGHDANYMQRIRFMTDQFILTANTVNAEVAYLKEEIKPEHLADCDLLFIHIPSTKYSPEEIKAVTRFLDNGGSLFIVMDADYWSTLEQTNVNDLITPVGIEYGEESTDTNVGGYTHAGIVTATKLKIPYHGARIVKGGVPFCFSGSADVNPFGTYLELPNGGKVIAMGEAMVSLYMTSWQDVDDYQCGEFMSDVFKWLLKVNKS